MNSGRRVVCVNGRWRPDVPEECKGSWRRVKNQVGLGLCLDFDLKWTLRLI
jgi:hypothetical protein